MPSGGEVTFTVPVHNTGPSTATDVTLTDTLPAGTYSNISASSTQGSCTAEVVCTIGSIAPGATVTITIVATVTANGMTLTNTASVTSATPDPVPADNSASAAFVVQKTTDLVLTKAVTQSPNAGETDGGTYTITVRNAGPLDATNVSVADTIPVDFTPSSVTAPGFTCNLLPGPGEQLSCSIPTLAAGEELTITVVGTFSVTSAGTTVVNGAQVTSDEADFNPDDNAAVAETIPIPSADLDFQKTASAVSVLPGETVVFTLAVLNAGPSPAADVTVTDTLPPGLTFVSSPDCTATGNVVTCAVGALAPGATRSLTMTAQASLSAAGQTVTNTATAASATPDPVSSNNSDTAPVVVQNPADLQLTKTVTPNPIAGVVDGGTYTITARSAGPNPTATNVIVVDQIPAEFTPRSVTAPGFTCDLPGAGGTLTCTRPTLTIAEGGVAISVTGTFDAASAGRTVVNQADVQADQVDPVSANNRASAATTPVAPPPPPPPPSPPQVDVAVTVGGPSGVVREGGVATFRLNVTNRGPGHSDLRRPDRDGPESRERFLRPPADLHRAPAPLRGGNARARCAADVHRVRAPSPARPGERHGERHCRRDRDHAREQRRPRFGPHPNGSCGRALHQARRHYHRTERRPGGLHHRDPQHGLDSCTRRRCLRSAPQRPHLGAPRWRPTQERPSLLDSEAPRRWTDGPLPRHHQSHERGPRPAGDEHGDRPGHEPREASRGRARNGQAGSTLPASLHGLGAC